MLSAWFLSVAAADCPSLDGATSDALSRFLAFDLPAAHTALGRAERALDCGEPAPPAALSRYFLVAGAVALADHDALAADVSMVAARRCDPLGWIDELGEEIRSAWEAAPARPGTASLTVLTRSPDRTVRVDGVPSDERPTVGAGLHVIQIVDADGTVVRGLLLAVDAGDTPVVEAPALETVGPEGPRPPPPPGRAFGPWLAAGASVSAGREVRYATVTEAAVHVVVPVEAGAELTLGPVVLRAAAAVAPVLAGPFVFDPRPDGDPSSERALPVQLGANAAVLTSRSARFGVLGAARLPGRLGFDVVGGWRRSAFVAEARAGLQLLTPSPDAPRPPEPCFTLVVGVSP